MKLSIVQNIGGVWISLIDIENESSEDLLIDKEKINKLIFETNSDCFIRLDFKNETIFMSLIQGPIKTIIIE